MAKNPVPLIGTWRSWQVAKLDILTSTAPQMLPPTLQIISAYVFKKMLLPLKIECDSAARYKCTCGSLGQFTKPISLKKITFTTGPTGGKHLAWNARVFCFTQISKMLVGNWIGFGFTISSVLPFHFQSREQVYITWIVVTPFRLRPGWKILPTRMRYCFNN